MTRDNLIQAIYDNADSWSCVSPCQHTMENENPKVACWECAEKQLAEYEAKVRADAIEEYRINLEYNLDFLSGIPQCYMARIFTMIESTMEQLKEDTDVR